AASGVEDRILPRVADVEAETGAVAQVVRDPLPEMMQVQDDVLHAAGAQEVEDVLEEGTARDRDERRRCRVGERPKARAAPGREHHRPADHASSGTWRARSGRTAASAGRAPSMRRATAYTPGR